MSTDTTPEIPAGHFVDADPTRPVPLVVLEATGEPAFVVVGGTLVPYAEWRPGQLGPASRPAQALTLQAGNGSFAGTIEVS